jgi:hypothetical protein
MTERFSMHADLADAWLRCHKAAVFNGDEEKARRCYQSARDNMLSMREIVAEIEVLRQGSMLLPCNDR